ncbi:hypothetical protein, partial [Aeromonas taiwanensis]|uniref:hypothetical protein n=1 Tax=Aeromonas taiwanensis TaxID=633417 RepID=UPI003F749578
HGYRVSFPGEWLWHSEGVALLGSVIYHPDPHQLSHHLDGKGDDDEMFRFEKIMEGASAGKRESQPGD